ncbi:MAG: DUF2249 domain-containing protein [Acidimicrobiales bacterium]
MTNNEAYALIVSHHRQLCDRVRALASALEDAVSGGRVHEVARAQLVSYMIDEVLPHARAEEETIYAHAAKVASLGDTVTTMVVEHQNLALGIERLARAATATDAVQYASLLTRLFDAHVTTENEVLLPPLVADESLSVAQLLTRMQELTTNESESPSSASGDDSLDHEAVLLSQLLAAAAMLARSGSADEACSMVAATWAVLRGPRPDLAVLATRSLHQLVRSLDQEPVALRARVSSDARSDDDTLLDVRTMAPAQRHETIFETYANLDAGRAFLLVNDHDPKPLRYQFDAEHADEFTWDYIESGPKVWRVRIARVAREGAGATSVQRG